MRLRGIFPGWPFGWFDDFDRSDLVTIKELGFNCVRVPIMWESIMPENATINETYFLDYIDRVVKWCGEISLYCILDFHQGHWCSWFQQSEGGPFDAAYGSPLWTCYPYPQTVEGYNQAVTDFWAKTSPQEGSQDLFIEAIYFTMDRYRNEPHVLLDILNEPPKGYLSDDEMRSHYNAFLNNTISAVREVSDAILIAEISVTDGYRIWPTTDVSGINIVWSYHHYDPWGDYLPTQYTTEIYRVLEYARNRLMEAFNHPCLVGEFGRIWNWENPELWYDDMLRTMEDFGMSWIVHSYQKSSTDFGIRREDGSLRPVINTIQKYMPMPTPIPIVPLGIVIGAVIVSVIGGIAYIFFRPKKR